VIPYNIVNVLFNYGEDITQKEKLQLILENAKEALTVLPSDHTTQYVACKYCEIDKKHRKA